MTANRPKGSRRSTRPAKNRRPAATIPPRRPRRPRPKPAPQPSACALAQTGGWLRPVRPTAQRAYESELFTDLE